jgi:hypothetical protein
MRPHLGRLILALIGIAVARLGGQAPIAAPLPIAGRPQPEDAPRAILAAFDTFRIVAIGDYHGTKDLNDFVLALVRHPAFPTVVNDIVLEGTNSLFQPILDRYVAGEDVPIDTLRQLWREPNLPTGASDFDLRLFQLVRQINRRLPAAGRLRVLAGEPPVDWRTVTTRVYETQYLAHREDHVARVIVNEVLKKNRKALMFYGGGHLRHGAPGLAMSFIEQEYPRTAFVIFPYTGASNRNQCALAPIVDGVSYESETATWPVPSLLRTKGTWLAAFGKSRAIPGAVLFQSNPDVDPMDAFLYLGPPSLLMSEVPSVFTFVDEGFRRELQRRLGIIPAGAGYLYRINPDSARARDVEVLRCNTRW